MDKIKTEDKPKQVQAKREFPTIDELKILIPNDRYEYVHGVLIG